MLSKCANASCTARFQYLPQGKLFRFDPELGTRSGPSQRRISYLWLCARCVREFCPRGLRWRAEPVILRLCRRDCDPESHSQLIQ